MSEWKPIESAPIGVEFLGWDSSARKMDVCEMTNISTKTPHWIARQVQMDGEYGPSNDEFGYDSANITHWTSLPAPPTPETPPSES